VGGGVVRGGAVGEEDPAFAVAAIDLDLQHVEEGAEAMPAPSATAPLWSCGALAAARRKHWPMPVRLGILREMRKPLNQSRQMAHLLAYRAGLLSPQFCIFPGFPSGERVMGKMLAGTRREFPSPNLSPQGPWRRNTSSAGRGIRVLAPSPWWCMTHSYSRGVC
jgi:hypothetical protein